MSKFSYERHFVRFRDWNRTWIHFILLVNIKKYVEQMIKIRSKQQLPLFFCMCVQRWCNLTSTHTFFFFFFPKVYTNQQIWFNTPNIFTFCHNSYSYRVICVQSPIELIFGETVIASSSVFVFAPQILNEIHISL